MFGRQHWTSAQGTIIASQVVKTAGDGLVTISEYVVDVRTPEGEIFRARVEEPRIAMDFMAPSVGTVVRVEFDPASHKVRFDKDDPSVNRKAMRKAKAEHFEQALAQAPDSSPGSRATAGAGLPSLDALVQSGGGNVVRLDAQDPDTAALRDMLLRAADAARTPPAAGPGTDAKSS